MLRLWPECPLEPAAPVLTRSTEQRNPGQCQEKQTKEGTIWYASLQNDLCLFLRIYYAPKKSNFSDDGLWTAQMPIAQASQQPEAPRCEQDSTFEQDETYYTWSCFGQGACAEAGYAIQ